MAIIGQIRKRGALIVIVIGGALLFFVLQDIGNIDLFRSRGLSGSDFARIGGEKVTYQEFEAKVRDQEELFRNQLQTENLSPEENFQVMTSAWDQMERSVIMQKEYEKLGLAVKQKSVSGQEMKPSISLDELEDLIMGQFLHPYIIQSFSDPATGQVNRQLIRNYLERFDELKQEEKVQWINLEKAIKEDRLNAKYNNLISKAYYMPKAFAKKQFEESNTTVDLRLAGVKYQTVPDSDISLTDADYKKYYDEHSYEFQVEPTCDIDYVVWEVLPSAEDRQVVEEQIAEYYRDFETAPLENIEMFVNSRSDARYDSTFLKKGALPVQMDSIMFNSPAGTTVSPYLHNGVYYMGKLVQIQLRPDSMRASHILFMHKDAPAARQQQQAVTRSEPEAKALVDSTLGVLRANPGFFGFFALEKSEFPTAKQDTGNLNWFADGDPEFKFFFDSCLNMRVGEMKIIQSNFGYHILYLTGKTPPQKKVKVAIITRDLKPSTQTYNEYFAKASEFAGSSRTKETFEQNVGTKGLNKRTAEFVRMMDFSLPGLDASREIIRWAFNKETETGSVSGQVFDLQGKYVVARLVDRREKGLAALEQVKTYIEPLVIREKKAEIIKNKLNSALGTTKDIYAIAGQFDTSVDTVTALNFNSYNLPNFGPESQVIGTIFGHKPNVLSKPVSGDMAVYLFQIDAVEPPPALTDYSMMQMQMRAFFQQRVQNDVFRAIKDKTEIKDNRILFY
jgi:peptidyl-prolyl cis-trans isomerase D